MASRFLQTLILFLLALLTISSVVPDWGFFAHRRINRLSVFTLPPEMILFYKRHLEYITEHAVDPDKRRYATIHEAPRHFIDIDHWGIYPFPEVPRDWTTALMRYTALFMVDNQGDTLQLLGPSDFQMEEGRLSFSATSTAHLEIKAYRQFFIEEVMPQYYAEDWRIDCEQLEQLTGLDAPCQKAFMVDSFSVYGILPYHLLHMQRNLTEAFRQQSATRILRLSAEMGHYIGDAHVPLHTTENYNGQLTDQLGIHAFWESRIPELFADADYDFFVGKAEYIEDPNAYFWEIVLASHRLVEDVLRIEKELSETFPRDRQYCFEERLGKTIRTQCREYAAAYQEHLDGHIEQRMRDAILSIGSSWYTAWVDAGQPDLSKLSGEQLSPEDLQAIQNLEWQFRAGEIKGREH